MAMMLCWNPIGGALPTRDPFSYMPILDVHMRRETAEDGVGWIGWMMGERAGRPGFSS